MNSHRDLELYKKSLKLVKDIYKLTESFPKSQIYVLSYQMQKAVISIPSNIAEGAARKGTKEFIQFLYIALGSAAELEAQLDVAEYLDFVKDNHLLFNDLKVSLGAIKMMLLGLIRKLEEKLSG